MARISVDEHILEENEDDNIAGPDSTDTDKDTEKITNQKNFIARSKSINVKVVLVALFIVSLILVIFLINTSNNNQNLKRQVEQLSANRQEAQENEAQRLKAEVGKIIELPKDELPTVATVVDADKVRNQSFFADSENGDKVLLFAQTGKAILYRPNIKKIIEVAPINLNNQQKNDTEQN